MKDSELGPIAGEAHKTVDDGGQAFPSDYGSHGVGMSLRDWYAGMAMQGELASQDVEVGEWLVANFDQLAKRSYALADQMLKARGEK